MFKGQILSGDWDKGILELENMPKDFVLSLRKLVVMEESEYADLIADRDKWQTAYEEDDIRTNGLCDKVTKLQETLGVILRNIKAGAVTTSWIEDYIKKVLPQEEGE